MHLRFVYMVQLIGFSPKIISKILDRPLVDTMEDPILGSLEPRESAPLCWGRVSKKAIAWLATGQCVLIFALLVLCFGLIIHTTVDDDDAIQGTPSSPPAPSGRSHRTAV